MNEDVKQAAARIREAIAGKEVGPVKVKVRDDKDGKPICQEWMPLAIVLAGDTAIVCESIPEEARTQIVRDLHRGSRAVPADRKVHQQVRCLTHLLGVAGLAG